jgi:hypothetical protein
MTSGSDATRRYPILPPPEFALPTWDDCADALLGVYVRHAMRAAREGVA